MEEINFDELSPEAQQEWVDIWLHEKQRHFDDIVKIEGYLNLAKERGITPRIIYVDKWIEISEMY